MEHSLRLSILPSQCYAPAPEYPLESCHGNIAPRQPLGESTGNAQRGQLGALGRSYMRHPERLSSMPPSILTPPIVPTQSLGSTYGSSAFTRSQDRRQSQLLERRKKVDVNPLWLYWQQFQNYRKKQDEKDDKSDQKWPQVLEDAFLDGLLIIPHIGRKKYVVRQAQYGRNMLLGEYLWLAYCASLLPGAEPDPTMMRERKQVSSHIQVLKNIFKHHKCCHIFLPKEIRKPKDAEEGDSLSLKRHPVLVALSEGRLPEQRPNYEYFARILALNNQVVIRPKRCWIFVSNRDVVVREDGSGCLAPTGEQLAREQYPHIERNLEREKWAKEEQQIFQGTLLHEYTKSFSQVESSALRELSREWKKPFPDLHDRLETLMAENAQGDIVAAESQCDIIHMQVVLELNEKRRYPSHSELNSWVEISIEKPHLLHHRWKVETRLVRPAELSYANGGSAPELVYKTSADITVQCQHRPGCDGPRGSADSCHCLAQYPRRDWVTVPFPADVWAPTLSNCAEYPAHPFSGGGKRRVKKIKTEVKREDGGDEEEAKSAPDNHHPTQMDLVPQIAMMQEIWSCPPDDAQGPADPDSQGSKRWTRRGLILWSFKTLHSVDGNGKLATAESGKTTWRFLTVLDPVSEYHLQNSLLSNDRNVTGVGYGNAMARPGHIATGGVPMISRDAVMSPSPTYQQHHAATMSENFSTLWGAADVLDSMSGPAGQAYEAHLLAQAGAGPGSGHSGAYRLMSGYGDHGGLATPPPSACLTNTFAQTFDVSTSGPGHVAAYLSAGAQPLVDEPNSASHSFLSAAGSSVFDVPAYNAPDGLPSWGGEVGGGVTSMEAGGWPSNYITAPSGNQHSEPDLGWAPTHGADMRAGSVGSSHHSHQHQAPVPQQQHPSHRHHWAPDISADGREEFTHWSANTPAHTILNSHAARNGRPAWAAAAAARTASCSSATTTDDNHDGGSQGWEPVGRCDSSAPATVSDISQEWEEIDNSHHNNDNSASGSSASALSEDGPSMHEDSSFIEGDGIAAKPDTERHFTGGADVPEGGVSPSPAPRGIKRSREDSFDDDVDAAGGYRVAPMPFRLGR